MLRRATFITVGLLTTLVAGAYAAAAAPDPAGVEFFEAKVRPVLAERCYSCHSATATKLKGNLRLDLAAGIHKGGDSELPAIIPEKPNDSLMIQAVRYELDDLKMPPKEKLSASQIADLEAWVKRGAPMPEDAKSPTTAPALAAAHPTRMSLADGRNFWSFKLPAEPKVPATVTPAGWAHNDVDRFVLAKLDENHLKPSAEADRRTLIRRATYDLTGLPPTAEEVDAFIADPAPDAYEKLIDRLLASPRYGERWGRHWLDVARYADTKGYVFNEERRYPFSYTYRDWVINAFNADLPYDQFLTQQIAADRLDLKGDNRPLAALGFLTVGRRFINNQTDIIDDRIDVVCRGTMAVTVACARCHDHKYDPIPTADYYSLYGVFASSVEPTTPPLLGEKDTSPAAAEYEKEFAKLSADRDTWLKTRNESLDKELRSPTELRRFLLAAQKKQPTNAQAAAEVDTVDDEKALNRFTLARWTRYLTAHATAADPVFSVWAAMTSIAPADFGTQGGPTMLRAAARAGVNPLVLRDVVGPGAPASLSHLAARYAALLARYDQPQPFADDPAAEAVRQVLRGPGSPNVIEPAQVTKRFNTADANKFRELQGKIDVLAVTHPGSPLRAMAMEDAPQPVEPHVFKRGNPGTPGDATPRQFLAILSPEKREPFKNGSGRLELAQAIASKSNPLTARVMVNRVWQWHFGRGLVRTASDFGTRGDPPTHPELLDYLALRFENEDGWSIKKLHKRIMLSATYRQSSYGQDAATLTADPDNRWLSHFNPQRMDFEELRDSLLAAAGHIDLTAGGRPVDILTQPFSGRRSVYAYIDRQNLPGVFRTFDFANPDMHQAQRPTTSVPQQALFMLNSPFVIQQARALATQPTIAAEADARRKIALLYRSILGRSPTDDEASLGVRFVQSESAQPTDETPVVKTPWQYGYGKYDDASGRLTSFTPLPHFVPTSGWQGGPALPDPTLGWALLTATGGHAGNDTAHAVVRRFVAPRDCTVSIDGTLAHNQPQGDGVRGRIVSSRDGTLATWSLHNRSADTKLSPLSLRQGDTLDFVTDCGPANDVGYDQFAWKVTLTKLPTPGAPAGDDNGLAWNSTEQFAGPAPKPPTPLTPWEKYAQVLLESNEFMFVD